MRAAGARFEQRARAELERAGLRLLECNYHSRYGELDLVMRERDCIVFVEVRYRRHAAHGDALASVTMEKQRRLTRAAQCWLADHPAEARRPCRFDVVTYDGAAADPGMHWHRAVFDAAPG